MMRLKVTSQVSESVKKSNTSANGNDKFMAGMSSGSGVGAPTMVARTFARQITLKGDKAIGVGKFGEVWLGVYKGDAVAVKVFHSVEENSWFREMDIYETNMLRDPNILRYLGSDNFGSLHMEFA
jgi:hypothetical protein